MNLPDYLDLLRPAGEHEPMDKGAFPGLVKEWKELTKGLPPGELVCLFSSTRPAKSQLHWNPSLLHVNTEGFSLSLKVIKNRSFGMTKKTPKHPERYEKKLTEGLRKTLNKAEHVRKGDYYILSVPKPFWDYERTYLWDKPPGFKSLGEVKTGTLVIVLDRVLCAEQAWVKIVYGDLQGYVKVQDGIRFKRITSRMKRRMETNDQGTDQPTQD